MNGKYLVGIDVGTTGTKIMIFDTNGNVVSNSYAEYVCSYPKPNWVEQDPNMLIDAVYLCAKMALGKASIDPKEIAGISISAQRCSVVFVDENDKPLKLISWLDNRATEQVQQIEDKLGSQEFYKIVGLPLCTTWMLPKIMWVMENEPEIWNKTHKITQVQDLILKALGADDYYTDEPEAGFFGFWDCDNFCWSDKILNMFNIPKSVLPIVKQSGTRVGGVTKFVSEKSGFAEGTPICVGIGDQNSAAIGSGIVKQGIISVSLGTGGLATALLSDKYRDPKGQTMVTNHALHGMWTFEGLQNGAAGVFRWFRDEIAALENYQSGLSGEDVYSKLNEMIESVPVGAKGLMMFPFFAGAAAPRWNSKATGAFFGLTFAHDRKCMARACIEGITMEQRDIMQSIMSNGVKFKKARIMGGATRSDIWNQVQADVYNLPCETLAVNDAAVMGAAMCAAVGVGIYKDIIEAAYAMVKVAKRYEPIPENVKKYSDMYKVYCNMFESMESNKIFTQLAELQ